MAELDTAGIAAVLAADAQTQVRVGRAAIVGSHLDQLANADLIQMLERDFADKWQIPALFLSAFQIL